MADVSLLDYTSFGSQGYVLVVSPLLPKITCWPLAQENLIQRLAGLALLTKTELLVVVVVQGLFWCFPSMCHFVLTRLQSFYLY